MLLELYTADTPIAKHFRTHIRKYNSALAFTSLNYQPDKRTQGGLQCFQIHSALYHMAGPLEHPANCKPQFAQLFLYDPQEQLQILLNPKLELVLALGKYTISILLMTNINIYIRS